ncbi:energy transducer TonB [Sphingomonas sp.]|uniref:energy transducer TonB n=1 Tax=Sphingomonas sp. TaxID=28214 RepID=UPI0031CFA8D2
MVFSTTSNRSGYCQPVQARAFGTGTLIVGGAVGALLLSIHWIAPPRRMVDVGQTAVFVAQSIPIEPKTEPVERPTPPQPPAVPSPSSPPAVTVPAAPASIAPTYPATANPVTLAAPSPMPQASDGAASTGTGEAPARSVTTTAAVAAASSAAAGDWRSRLLGHLKRYRRYPRQAEAARQQGIARIAITVRRSGEVTAVELIQGSGYPLLDQEARATARRASPVPPVDDDIPGDPVTVEVPIDFALRR